MSEYCKYGIVSVSIVLVLYGARSRYGMAGLLVCRFAGCYSATFASEHLLTYHLSVLR